MITKEMAMQLELGQILYHKDYRNSDGSPERWRVNGQCKIWKTRPKEFRLPIKWGLKTGGYLDQTCPNNFFVNEDEALGRTMQYRLLKALWNADSKYIGEQMVISADVAINNNWDLDSEVAFTHLFDDGAFDPFYASKTNESQAYQLYCQDYGNEDDETELLGELWITTLKETNSKRFKDVIAKFKDIKDNGL